MGEDRQNRGSARREPADRADPFILVVLFLFSLACACAKPLALDAPNIAPGRAREPTRVELEPFAERAGAVVGDFASSRPAAVLTAAMKAEIEGRALHGGAPPGGDHAGRCSLDRFPVRKRQS